MISYSSISEKDKYRFERYLTNYEELIEAMNLKEPDENGWRGIKTVLTGSMAGELEPHEKAWIKSIAVDFRKLMEEKKDSSGYQSIKKTLNQLFQNDPEVQEHANGLFRRLALLEKQYWNRIILPNSYNGSPLTEKRVIKITHNQYLFHDGTSKDTNMRSSNGKTDFDADFRKDYPKTNPLIVNYLGLISGRLMCLGLLSLFINEFKADRFMELELNDNIQANEILKTKVTVFVLPEDFDVSTISDKVTILP